MADEAEAKRLRKVQKKVAKEAAVAAAAAEEEEIKEAEAKAQRKAAKRAAKEAAAAAVAEKEEEVDEVEAKRQRKAARRAAKEAAAAQEAEAEEVPKNAKKAKRAAEPEEAEEAPKVKKSKQLTEQADDVAIAVKEETCFKVFIKGLLYSANEASIRTKFAECGEITELQLPMQNGQSKGIAFISFANQQGFDAALKYDNTFHDGRYLYVSKANADGKRKDAKREAGKGTGKASDWHCPKCGDLVFARNNACRQCGAERPGGQVAQGHDHENTVFLRGLPWSATEENLRKDFAECGQIESIRIPMNAEGRPSGLGFIKFAAPEGVAAALKFDETPYGGRTLNVCKSGEAQCKGKGTGKGNSKDGACKGKHGKGNGKDSKGKGISKEAAITSGCIVASTAVVKTFEDSDDE